MWFVEEAGVKSFSSGGCMDFCCCCACVGLFEGEGFLGNVGIVQRIGILFLLFPFFFSFGALPEKTRFPVLSGQKLMVLMTLGLELLLPLNFVVVVFGIAFFPLCIRLYLLFNLLFAFLVGSACSA
ncbi:hypothetical protein MLD38_014127 [Melastoma candidum]|uniref:Uncharacterized protein n=1 Tax=Melastoma candidum TaxID=119954 RepID=A0ACB9RCY7_9MYRT|nr:hypothetical protein MLD38_014127 [Melastoma candidum]